MVLENNNITSLTYSGDLTLFGTSKQKLQNNVIDYDGACVTFGVTIKKEVNTGCWKKLKRRSSVC